MADRAEFLARIKQAAAAGRAYQVALNPAATACESYVGGGSDPVATFLKEWRAVGGFGERVQGATAAWEYVQRVCDAHQVRSALCWKHPLLEKLGLGEFLRQAGIEARMWEALEQESPVQRWQRVFSADIGITSVTWGVAETGSLCMCAEPGRGRSASLLPPVHVALIEPSQLVPDLFDLFATLGENISALPANMTLITGPSKTGDIQLQLTTGVHGPGEVHAVIVE